MKFQASMRLLAAIVFLSIGLAGAAPAEVNTVRIAKQFGLGYLPLTVMEEEKLFEQQAKKQGLDIKVEWLRLPPDAKSRLPDRMASFIGAPADRRSHSTLISSPCFLACCSNSFSSSITVSGR